MKIIVIGDLHGRDHWKQIDVEKYDKVIFIGDYCDSYTFDNQQVLKNLLEVIQLKKQHPDKIVTLLGNHDIQYMFPDVSDFRCAGIRPEFIPDANKAFMDNKDLFKMAHLLGKNHLFTHAGVSNGWYGYNKNVINEFWKKFQPEDIADMFNMMMWAKESIIMNVIGIERNGYVPFGGITWADYKETVKSPLQGYQQYVGHTPRPDIERSEYSYGSITYCDVLKDWEPMGKFHEFEIKDDQIRN